MNYNDSYYYNDFDAAMGGLFIIFILAALALG